MEFNSQVSWATIGMLVANVILVVGFVWKRSSAETELKLAVAATQKQLADIAASWKVEQTAFDQHVRELEANRQRWREDMERTMDQRLGGIIGQHNLLRDQFQEMRENVGKNYMTKSEINAIEIRVTGNQDRIITRLEKLDERLGQMHGAVMAAIGKNH